MSTMILGLVLFLGPHSIRIFADEWRSQQINQYGENLWKIIYSVISVAGFMLIIQGYAQARLDPVVIWAPPIWLKNTVVFLLLPTFVLIIAAYLPGTKLKSAAGHPMAAAVKLWALGHLLANGTLADIILFASFQLWSIFDYRASRRRDKKAGTCYPFKGYNRDIIAVATGVLLWALFTFYFHERLIGVRPFT